jgi:signal transduction histidine kinase/DNA-binding response OmpR family regulator/ligand-binding sensor domain-containing protein
MFVYKHYIFIFILLLVVISDEYAQQIRFDHFDTRKGLSQNNINSLVIDSTGYVWIGTIEGLTRFDGSEFKIFRPFPGDPKAIRGNIVKLLAPCSNGNLWAFTYNGGLNLYNAALERFYFFPDSLFNDIQHWQISSLASPTDTSLWFTCRNNVFRFDVNRKITRLIYKAPSEARLVSIGQQTIWIYGRFGIRALNIEPRQGSPVIKNILSTPIRVISENYGNKATIISNGCIRVFDLNTQKITSYPLKDLDKNLEEANIISVAGRKNEIWLGQYDGLTRVSFRTKAPAVTKYYYDPYNSYSFCGKDATSLVFDKAENLWIGTSKYGIHLVCKEKNYFTHHQVSVLSKADIEIDPVRAICKTTDKAIWVGFDRLGLVKIFSDNQQILFDKVYYPDNRIAPLDKVRSLFEDSHGNLWIGSSSGLCIYHPIKKRIESVSLAFGWKWPYSCYVMKEFDKGQLIITCDHGIAQVDLPTMQMAFLPLAQNGLNITRSIRGMVRDNNKNLWVTLDNSGLYKISFPDFRYKHFTRETHGLTDNKLYNLAITGNTLWIASNTGLIGFDMPSEKITASYFETDGLSNNLVYSVIETGKYLWISTNRGLNCFDPIKKHFENFLPDDLFMDDASFKDHEGNIYFGGYDGFISFAPDKFQHTALTPTPHIVSFYFNNRKVEVGEKIDGHIILPVSIQKISRLKLNYSLNTFSLAFDAFPFTYPDRALFRYRMPGLSDNWLPAGKNENKAVFTNLSPGTYTFQVESSQNGITWSSPASLTIEVIPPFWKTGWFRLSFLCLLVLTGIALFQLRIYAIKRRNILLQKKVERQTRSIEEQKNKIISQKDEMVELSHRLHEADQAKLKFYTNISHEFRTPLTLILGNTDTLSKQGTNNFALRNIQRNAERLNKLVNQFIDLRKYDQGELKLAVTKFDIVSFTVEIAESFRELADSKHISVHSMNDQEPVWLWLDKDKTDKILYNIISNAVKYTDKGGSIVIDFQKQTHGLELSISDTGYGIPDKEQVHIFESFFRGTHTQTTTDGHGIGLALVKALTEIQKATITFRSKVGEGSTFRILFRWGREHFCNKDFEDTQTQPIAIQQKPGETEHLKINVSNPAGEEILIVEDNEELTNYLVSLFGPYYTVQKARNGKEAIEWLAKNMPDLIITDLMMPVMDGLDFCKALKEKNDTMFIPVIILSAKADVASKIEGLKINVDDYIEKPFHPDLLLLKVNNLLKKRYDIKQKLESNLFSPGIHHKLNKAGRMFLEKTISLLDENLADANYSVDILSAGLCMSRVTFYRRMKEITGEGPGEFIRKYRLKRAAQILREQQKAIGEVCTEVGFQSLSHFRQSFKEEFGVLPSEYIKG